MTTHFNYWLTGSGWAEIFLTSDKQNIRFEFSYLSDPLGDLLAGLCKLINNQTETERVVFAEEPGEHSLTISKIDKENIKLEIFWNDEWEDLSKADKKQTPKELIYSDADTLKNLALVILAGIDNLLERHTLTEYEEQWSSFEFPMDKYKQLRQLLS
jgi:hypothetical protein